MNACAGCKRNCCVDQGSKGGIKLFPLDCIKVYSEALSDSSFSIKKNKYSLDISYNNSPFARLNYFFGLSGNLAYPCPSLSKELLCKDYFKEVSDSYLKSWLKNKEVSTNFRPFVCRAFPHIVESWFHEGNFGWAVLGREELRNNYDSGCKISLNPINKHDELMLRNEINLNLNSNHSFVNELLKGNLEKILVITY